MAVRIICLYSGSPVSFWRRGCCFWQQYFCWLTFLCHGGAQSESDQSPSRVLPEFLRSLSRSRPSHRGVSLEPCRRSSGVLPGSLWHHVGILAEPEPNSAGVSAEPSGIPPESSRSFFGALSAFFWSPAVIMAESSRSPVGILSESCRSLGVVMAELWRSHARWHSTIAAMRVAVASDWRGGDQSFLAKGASLPGGSHLVRSPRARFSSISSRVYPLVSGMTFQIQKTPTNPTSP